MISFKKIQLNDSNGDEFPGDVNVYRVPFNAATNQSVSITLVPVITDDGQPQDVRLVSVIKDKTLYNFSEPPKIIKRHEFNTGANPAFSFDFHLDKMDNDPAAVNCQLDVTLVFKDAAGEEEKERLPVLVQFQN